MKNSGSFVALLKEKRGYYIALHINKKARKQQLKWPLSDQIKRIESLKNRDFINKSHD